MTDDAKQPAAPTPWGAPPPEAALSPPARQGSATPPPPRPVAPPAPSTPTGGSPIWGGAPTNQGWTPPGPYAASYTPVGPLHWYSLRGLATGLTVVLWTTVGALVLAALAALRERGEYADAFESFSAYESFEDAEALAGGLLFIALLGMLAIAVLLIIWMWRAAKDLEALGRFGPSLGAGWAIGGWFVPLASLVLPCIVAVDLWKGSDATIPGGNADWKRARTSPLVGLWWAAWVGANLLGTAFSFSQPEGDTYATTDDYLLQNTFQIAWLLALVAAGVLCVFVVRRITARLEETLAAQHAAWHTAQAAAPPTAVG